MPARTAGLLACLAVATTVAAQPTAFTYQGRLRNGPQPASGLHDFRFRLFDAVSAGNQVGSIQCVDNILVAEGLFSATIDFGQQFDTPSPRFLEIEVRADTGLTCGSATGFVVLGPRQPLTAAPLASHAKSAFSLDAPDGSPANAVFVNNDGKVGVGTTAPTHTVHIAAAEPTLALQDTDSTSSQVGYVSYRDSANAERAWVGYGTAGSPEFSVVNARPSGDLTLWTIGDIHFISNSVERMIITPTGNVGIGTTTPAAKLDVRGNIRLGGTGELLAPGGTENLRLLRGNIDGNGTIDAGSGFTCQRINEGMYRISFLTPFSGVPTVTATPVWPVLGPLRTAVISSVSSSQVTIYTVFQDSFGPGFTDSDWSFCVIGPR